jgi:disulfide bond formation protein DsbB
LYSETKLRSGWPGLTTGNGALLIVAVSAASLAGAWVIEFMGYKPCPLCLEERIPYYAAVSAGLLAAYLSKSAPRSAALILGAVCLGLLYNAGIGVYHAGAEWHLWKGPQTCSGDAIQLTGSLAERLKHNSPVRCDEAALRIFGISLAGYSALISFGLAAIGAIALTRSRINQAQ